MEDMIKSNTYSMYKLVLIYINICKDMNFQ